MAVEPLYAEVASVRVLEHIGVRIDIGQAGVFRILDQGVRDIRGDVDGVLGLGIVVADVADVSDHTGGGAGQLILIDCQDTAGHRFAGGQVRFCRSAVLSLPGDGQSGSIQCQRSLVKENSGSQFQVRGRPAGSVCVRQHIGILALGLRKIGSDVRRQLPLVGNVDKGLLTGSQNSRHFKISLYSYFTEEGGIVRHIFRFYNDSFCADMR